MKSPKSTARWIGILYIIGTVSGVLSLVFTSPIRNAPDLFTYLPMHQNQLLLGAMAVLAMGLALGLIPVIAFPVMYKKDQTLAVGYLIFRGALETFTYLLTVLSWLLLLGIAGQSLHASRMDAPGFQFLGELVLEGQAISFVGTVVFIIGAFMFYFLLYKSRLVPRWLSGWGLIAALPYLLSAFMALFGLIGYMSTPNTILQMPLAIQEMVLAVWLIVKGFNPAALEDRAPAA